MDGMEVGNSGSDVGSGKGALPMMLLPFPVLLLDAAGRVVESNGALEREIGVPAGTLLGHPLLELVDEQGKRALGEVLGPSSAPARAVELRFPAGLVRHPPRAFTPVRRGELLWLVGEQLSMDEQREYLRQAHHRAEAQADEYARVSAELQHANHDLERYAQRLGEATSAKYRFLATMSHELRTPLNAVLGYAGLLRDGVYGDISQPQERALRSMVRRARDLQVLIDDVLDLSRIEAGRMELRIDEFDPAAVVAEVKDEMAPLVNEKELGVVVRYNLRGMVRADRAKYRQVVLNLVSNAVKFTPERGEVEVSLEAVPDDRFITRVRDTGIGISREKLGSIFDTFQQVESGTTRRYQGLGLGLSIVRRVVQIMGGTVEVESHVGRGTVFTVTLPVRPDSEVIATSVEEPSEGVHGDPIVLAIDDDPEVIALLRDSLAPAHFRVVGALSGDRGLELAHILKPFAITLDIMMPEKDGWQVLREIKNDPAISDIPVIVMSIVSERALGFSLGVTDYLVKPVDRGVLLGVLERLRDRAVPRSALVVDDDFDARTLMSDLLSSLGLSVRAASSGDEAIAQLRHDVPDMLFLDLTMPEAEVGKLLDALKSDQRLDGMRTVVVTRSDVQENPEWRQRAATAVVYPGTGHADQLLRELRGALASIATPV
ncbi:MAG: ATP-binding protein [Gemmatimonadaceae bacterium]